MWFVGLCLVSVAVPLGILYVLFGPTKGKPLTPVARMSMSRMPTHPAASRGQYSPENVYAVEQARLIATIAPIPVPVRNTAVPPPLPRSRMARGSEAPPTEPFRRQDDTNPGNPFAEDDPTYVGTLA